MDELIKIGALDLDDLEVNHLGILSGGQRRRLGFWMGLWMLLAGVDVAIWLVYIYFWFNYQMNWLLGFIISALIINLIYICVKNAQPYWDDLKNNEVHTSSGLLFKHFSRYVGNSGARGVIVGHCSIRVGNQIFSVSTAVFGAVVEGRSYRLYFAPDSRRLINIEPL